VIRGHVSLILGPRVKESSTSTTSSSGKDKRISPHKSPSFAPFKDFEERGRLPQTPNDDVPDNIYVTNMEFVTNINLASMWPKCLTLMSALAN